MTDVSTEAAAIEEEAETYDELVIWAAKGAILVLLAKIISVVILGQILGAPAGVDFWFGFIPHLIFSTTQANFTLIVTLSSLAMALTGLIFAGLTYADQVDESTQQRTGRGIASVIALQTLAMEVFRHEVIDPTIRWRLAWLVIVTGLGGITLIAITIWKDLRRGVEEELQGSPKT